MSVVNSVPASQKVFQNHYLVKALCGFMDYDDQERLKATASAGRAAAEAHQREVIPKLFDAFIKDLFPGGEQEFNQLPIQVWRQRVSVPNGPGGEKAVNLTVQNLKRVNGQIPAAVIGVEVNEADTFRFAGWPNEHQPFRPFLAIAVRSFREPRSSCLPSLTVQEEVHVIYRGTSHFKLLSTWSALGPIPTVLSWGRESEYYFSTGLSKADKNCFGKVKRILAGEVLSTAQRAPSGCGFCVPSPYVYCCNSPCHCAPGFCLTPGAPFQALFFDTAVKMEKLGHP